MSGEPPQRRRMVPGYMGLAGLSVPDQDVSGVERTTLLYRSQTSAAGIRLDPAARRFLGLVEDSRVLSTYEVAAGLELPYGVVRMMTAALTTLGLLEARPPAPPAEQPDPALLEVLLNGLRAL
ncbi:DUF742 domain-containing protein [Streptomyces sp. NPDC059096]|uniref:DUF742 domain-containing protein n=1 Tax=Streptomyces sp. NPDC059096 TaxID=3346727 RepID=UPI003695931E